LWLRLFRCDCGREFCYLCGKGKGKCTCPLWNEEEFFARAEEMAREQEDDGRTIVGPRRPPFNPNRDPWDGHVPVQIEEPRPGHQNLFIDLGAGRHGEPVVQVIRNNRQGHGNIDDVRARRTAYFDQQPPPAAPTVAPAPAPPPTVQSRAPTVPSAPARPPTVQPPPPQIPPQQQPAPRPVPTRPKRPSILNTGSAVNPHQPTPDHIAANQAISQGLCEHPGPLWRDSQRTEVGNHCSKCSRKKSGRTWRCECGLELCSGCILNKPGFKVDKRLVECILGDNAHDGNIYTGAQRRFLTRNLRR
jgi:hypothetical protein